MDPKHPEPDVSHAWIMPAVFAAGLLGVLGSLLVLAERHSNSLQEATYQTSANLAVGSVAFSLRTNREFLERVARSLTRGELDEAEFRQRAARHMGEHSELSAVVWLDADAVIQAAVPDATLSPTSDPAAVVAEQRRCFDEARRSGLFVYTSPLPGEGDEAVFEIVVPVFLGSEFVGALRGRYLAKNFLSRTIPHAVLRNQHVTLIGGDGRVLAELMSEAPIAEGFVRRVALDPPGHGVTLTLCDHAPSRPWGLVLLGVLCVVLTLGMAAGMWGLQRQLAERRRVEEAMRQSEEKYRTLFNHSADAMLLLVEDRFIDCNEAAVSMLHCASKEEVLRMHPWELSPETQFDGRPSRERASEIMADAMRRGTLRFQWDHRRMDGEVFPVEVLLTRIRFGGRDVLHVVWRDITERKRSEQEREHLIEKLEAQNSELERFTYTVSHDLKSPLITIKGYLGLLRDDLERKDVAAVEDDMRRINDAGDKMARLLGELLEMSRIGRVVGQQRTVPMEELVREALELVRGQIDARHVEVEVVPNLPTLYGDPPRLLEVVQNLVDNAVKYMGDQRQPRIEIGSRLSSEGPICYVRDNGVGIEPAYHEKIFGLFEQLDSTAEGSGVGLALVKRIVEVHGGRIWVESDGPGQGATFCFFLPPARENSGR